MRQSRNSPSSGPYTVWDLTLENCGVRVALASKACVISVRIGEKKKFATIGTVGPDGPYETVPGPIAAHCE